MIQRRCEKCCSNTIVGSIEGARSTCRDCGAQTIVGTVNGRGYALIHRVCEEGEIPLDREDRTGAVYQANEAKRIVHVTCPKCGRIVTARFTDVDKNGYVSKGQINGCLMCYDGGQGSCGPHCCGLHFWPYLEGWAKRRPKQGEKDGP